jgi:hypothetical protein
LFDQSEIADAINNYFTALKSNSGADHDECESFSFEQVNDVEVDNQLSELLNSSGPGISEISIKIFKEQMNGRLLW